MRNKEELALMWIIVGAASIVTIIIYPPILLVGIFMYAAINLYKHYNK